MVVTNTDTIPVRGRMSKGWDRSQVGECNLRNMLDLMDILN